MNSTHEATVTAAEHRVTRGALDDVTRGSLAAIRRHSPALAPRITEVLRADAARAARRERRIAASPVPDSREDRAAERRAFVERGEVL